MLSASKPKCNFGHWSKITLKSPSYLLPKFSRVPLTIVLIPLITTIVNGTLLNFGKRYEDNLRYIFDQWQKLYLGLNVLSNQKILNGICFTEYKRDMLNIYVNSFLDWLPFVMSIFVFQIGSKYIFCLNLWYLQLFLRVDNNSHFIEGFY